MERLGLECLSVFGLHPVEFIRIAGELGCGHVSLNLSKSANRFPQFPEFSIRDDMALRRDIVEALADSDVRLSLLEGFALRPDPAPADLAAQLDIAAELGARAVCAVSLDKDKGRMHDGFARLAEMAGERGLLLTTEVGAGVLRNLTAAMEAVRQTASPHFALLIDTMHFFRTGSVVEDLAALDPALIGHVQLCDVPMPAQIASYMTRRFTSGVVPETETCPCGNSCGMFRRASQSASKCPSAPRQRRGSRRGKGWAAVSRPLGGYWKQHSGRGNLARPSCCVMMARLESTRSAATAKWRFGTLIATEKELQP